MQEGRFAGSRWSGHDDEFACVQSEVEVDEHVHLLVAPAVRLFYALELQYRLPAWTAVISVSGRRARLSNCWRLQCFPHQTGPSPFGVLTD
jgi:hypothetical protein